MIEIEKYQPEIETLCRELSLERLDLIGSAARNDFTLASDVDVLVTFDGNESLFDRYFTLKERLEAIFDRQVDVIEERAIRNPYFKASIEKDRVKIYGK